MAQIDTDNLGSVYCADHDTKPPLEKMLQGRRCQPHKSCLSWWLQAQSHIWWTLLSSGGAPGWTTAYLGTCKSSLKSTELQYGDNWGNRPGFEISISSMLSVTLQKVKIESTLAVIGSILYFGKPRTRPWKSLGLCKNETGELDSCHYLQIPVAYTFMSQTCLYWSVE